MESQDKLGCDNLTDKPAEPEHHHSTPPDSNARSKMSEGYHDRWLPAEVKVEPVESEEEEVDFTNLNIPSDDDKDADHSTTTQGPGHDHELDLETTVKLEFEDEDSSSDASLKVCRPRQRWNRKAAAYKNIRSYRQRERDRGRERRKTKEVSEPKPKKATQGLAKTSKELTEEERARKKMEIYLQNQAWRASFSKEEWEERMSRQRAQKRAAYARKSAEEKKIAYQKFREKLNNLSEDKRKKVREMNTKSCHKYMQKLKKEDPDRYRKYTVGAMHKSYGNVLEYQRRKTATETPEEREKRLLRYRISQARKKEKERLDQEGITAPEQVNKRLAQVEAEVRSRPIKKTEYKPRMKARKPHSNSSRDPVVTVAASVTPTPSTDQPDAHTCSLVEKSLKPVEPAGKCIQESEAFEDSLPTPTPPSPERATARAQPDVDTSRDLPELLAKRKKITNVTTEICDMCGETCKDKRRLLLHKHTVHSCDSSSFQCPSCSHLATSSRGLWHHYVSSHGGLSALSDLPAFQHEVRLKTTPKRDPRYQDAPNICEICGKQFRQKCTLDDHVRRAHQGKGYYCTVCSADCQSSVKLWRHQVERHKMRDLPPPPGVQVVLCRYCGQMIMRGYEAHVRKKHPESLEEFRKSQDNIKLPNANKTRTSRTHQDDETDVTESSTRKKTTGPYVRPRSGPSKIFDYCHQCSKLIRRDLMVRHMRQKHAKCFACPDCGREFGEVYKVHEHYREVHAFEYVEKVLLSRKFIKMSSPRQGKAAKCRLCGNLNLPDKFVVRAHFLMLHNDLFEQLKEEMMPTFKCEFCPDLEYTKEVDLRQHFQSEHPDKSLYCSVCGRFKRTQAELAMHMVIHDRKGGKFSCFICNVEFSNSITSDPEEKEKDLTSQLTSHVKSKHPEKFFPCTEPSCSTFMYSQKALDNHQSSESHCPGESFEEYLEGTFGKMRIKCDHCDKFLELRNGWGIHMTKMHGMEKWKRHKCQHCEIEYKRMEYLVGHVNIVHDIPIEKIVTLQKTQTKSIQPRGRRNHDEINEIELNTQEYKRVTRCSSRPSSKKPKNDDDWIQDINNYFSGKL